MFDSFKVLIPNEITTANFMACSVAEPDTTRVMGDGLTGEVEWVSGTTYVQNRRIIRASTHRVYRDAVGGISNTAPELDPTRWINESPTNKWAWVDGVSNTRTTAVSPLTLTVRPGAVTNIGFAGLVDVALIRVQIYATPGGLKVHDVTYSAEDLISDSPLWDLYFTNPVYTDKLLIEGLPVYTTAEIVLTISGYNTIVGVGIICFGTTEALGGAEVNAEAIYRDYGYTTTDKWGNSIRTAGQKAKDLKCSAVFPIEYANNIDRTMSRLLDVGAMYIPHPNPTHRFLITWGIIKPASIRATDAVMASADFDIEGLT